MQSFHMLFFLSCALVIACNVANALRCCRLGVESFLSLANVFSTKFLVCDVADAIVTMREPQESSRAGKI